MNSITIYPYLEKYKKQYYKNSEENLSAYFEHYYQKETSILNSARVGLYSALQYYNFTSARENHILVPKYISSCVLNVLNNNSFPVRKLDEQTKAILIFHQWGYPQKMDKILPIAKDKQLIVIEDCAHSFSSKYKNKLIGTHGDFSIFSFPKVFSSFTGGMIISGNSQLIKKVNEYKKSKDELFVNIFQRICFLIIKKNSLTNKNFLNQDLLSICYSKYISLAKIDSQSLRLLPPNQEIFEYFLNARKRNFNYIKENIRHSLYRKDIETDSDVCPFAVPIFANESQLEKIKNDLKQNNVLVDILHFDINRNILRPDYQKCIALPCHHLLKLEDLQLMVKTINQAVI